MTIPVKEINAQTLVKGLTPNWDFYPVSGTNMGNMEKTVTTLSRIPKLDSVFKLGPTRYVKKILTPDANWKTFEKAKTFLNDNNYYGFLLEHEKEGVSIWILNLDDSFTVESFNEIVKNDIVNKKWNTAYIDAQKKMKDNDKKKDPPFMLVGVLSASYSKIPWFGRSAWGTGYANGILSLTQIPTMGRNTTQYCTWSFVCKDGSIKSDEDLYKNYTKGGNETTYTDFKKYRDFLLSDACEPANPDGDYSFLQDAGKVEEPKENNSGESSQNNNSDNKEAESNPLIDAATKKEGFFRSRYRSVKSAQKQLISEYRKIGEYGRIFEYDDDDDISGEVASDKDVLSLKSEYFVCTVKRQNGSIPYGPLY